MKNLFLNKTTFKDSAQHDNICYKVDATGQTVGRISSMIAGILLGKRPLSPSANSAHRGPTIYLINAKNVVFSGKKWERKEYFKISTRPGHLAVKSAKQVLQKNPAHILEVAIRGMLPKNNTGKLAFKNLIVFNSDIRESN